MEDLVREAIEALGGDASAIFDSSTTTPTPAQTEPTQTEPTQTETRPPEPTPPSENERSVPDIDLGLSIRMTERTFSFQNSGAGYPSMRITSDNNLQVESGGAGNWQDIDTNVRSFARNAGLRPPLIFYIKNDNTLWGMGNNENGLLGDGTGVNRDEPVNILDNVADILLSGSRAFALQTDGTLLEWGGGNFAPIHVADGVARIIAGTSGWANRITFQTSEGYLYAVHEAFGETIIERTLQEPVFDIVSSTLGQINIADRTYYINHERILVQRLARAQGMSIVFDYEEIASDVERVFYANRNIFFITSNGSLWGMGQNANGELGDGTRVPREEPVHIADNVMYASTNFFIKTDGAFWIWDSNNPTPRQLLENASALVTGSRNQYILFQDGTALVPPSHAGGGSGWNVNVRANWFLTLERGASQQEAIEVDNIRVPQTLTFN